MFCQKCGKELKEGTKCSNCENIEQEAEQVSGISGIICTMIGVVGALISFPTFISEITYNARWHGGIIGAIERLFDDTFWVIPIVGFSVFFLILGLQIMFGKKS